MGDILKMESGDLSFEVWLRVCTVFTSGRWRYFKLGTLREMRLTCRILEAAATQVLFSTLGGSWAPHCSTSIFDNARISSFVLEAPLTLKTDKEYSKRLLMSCKNLTKVHISLFCSSDVIKSCMSHLNLKELNIRFNDAAIDAITSVKKRYPLITTISFSNLTVHNPIYLASVFPNLKKLHLSDVDGLFNVSLKYLNLLETVEMQVKYPTDISVLRELRGARNLRNVALWGSNVCHDLVFNLPQLLVFNRCLVNLQLCELDLDQDFFNNFMDHKFTDLETLSLCSRQDFEVPGEFVSSVIKSSPKLKKLNIRRKMDYYSLDIKIK